MLSLMNSNRVLGRGKLLVQKHSPEILTGIGLLSMTSGAVLAVRATLKLESVVTLAEARIAAVRVTLALSYMPEVEEYSEKEYKQDLYKAYLRNVLEFTKLYGPAVSLFVAGAGSIIAGHGIMRKRNVALLAAYNAVEKSFAAYRARLIEDLGPDKDRDYRYGITESSEKGEDGKKVSVIEVDPTKTSKYVRIFDETNDQWQSEPGYNQFFLTAEQNYLNDKLLARGHVFLNEVYDRLGFDHTPEGSIVGWFIDKNGSSGDNYIDFGMYDASTQAKRNFVNGYEKSIWLDFNVDGVIYNKL